MSNSRENWGSRLGVILAVAGSAVGLGNFLVFPGRVAANGGGAFLIPYFIAFILIGIPLAWMEWALGRRGGKYGHGTGPGILNTIIDHPSAKYLGSLGVVGPMLIFFFYIFIESWLLGYIYFSATGELSAAAANGAASVSALLFDSYLTGNHSIVGIPSVYLFFSISFLLNFGIIFFGVRKGIENTAKVLMPLLLILGFILMIRVLTLPGISSGLGFMWNPDFSKLLDIEVWFQATSQIFFTLSVGVGTILTYASYVKPKQDIALSSLTANSTNEFIEVIIGGTIVIPAAVTLLGAAATEGVAKAGVVDLGFITMPLIFDHMGDKVGFVLQVLWFTLLFIGGLTSSISMLQPSISFLEDELRLERKTSIVVLGLITLFFSLLVIYGFNCGAAGEIDLWGFNFSLIFFGTIEAITFAWILGVKEGVKELLEGAEIGIPKPFLFIMKYITPTFLIGLVFLWFTKGGGWDRVMLTNLVVENVSLPSIPLLFPDGIETTNRTFIIFFRGALLSLLIMVNWTIFVAWRNRCGVSILKEVDNECN